MGKRMSTNRRAVELRVRGAERQQLRALETLLQRAGPTIDVRIGGAGAAHLTRTVTDGLREVVHGLSESGAVTITPVDDELTTQDAADILNVSRPYLVKLLERDALPYRKVGTHRRLMRRDVLAYAEGERARRQKVLGKMVEEAEDSGLDKALDVTPDEVVALEDEDSGS